MENQKLQEIWQVDAGGGIYETDFENLANWIAEGSLLPQDKIRRGNLSWREAGTVRRLRVFFEAKEKESKNNFPVETESLNGSRKILQYDFPAQVSESKTANPPNAAKISDYSKPIRELNNAAAETFGFAAFAKALVYPFKFKASLIFGAILFTIFWVGQSIWVFGGLMLVSAIFCAMLANTLTFGVLANTVKNFSNGKTTTDFMPRFDDFSAWDDVIHPFLLSIGVYIISFGLTAVLLIGATWYAVDSLKEIDKGKDKIVSAVLPVPPNDLNLVKQSEQVSRLTAQFKKQNKNFPDEAAIIQAQSDNPDTAAIYENLPKQVKQIQIAPTETSANNDLSEMPANVMRLSLIFSIPIFLAFLWGVFYFPAACAVAAYTRSFTATLNPLIGFDTIKRLGFDYAKILGVNLILGVLAVVFNSVLGSVFAPFDLPQIGNLPVKMFNGVLCFYFFVVFSIALGFVVYKNSRKLKLN